MDISLFDMIGSVQTLGVSPGVTGWFDIPEGSAPGPAALPSHEFIRGLSPACITGIAYITTHVTLCNVVPNILVLNCLCLW